MAVKFKFVSAFLCDSILREDTGVHSAIRIVDVFLVPENTPPNVPIQFYLFVSLKTAPVVEEEFRTGFTIVRSNGERETIKPASDQPFKLETFAGDPSVPSGLSIALQINLIPRNMGTGFVEVDVDGEVVATVPFTLRRPSPKIVTE